MNLSSLLPPPKHEVSIGDERLRRTNEKNSEMINNLIDKHNVETNREQFMDNRVLDSVNFEDLVPLRQRHFDMKIPLPSPEEIEKCYINTKRHFDEILSGKVSHEDKLSNKLIMSSTISRSSNSVEARRDPLMPKNEIPKNKRKIEVSQEIELEPILHKTDTTTTNANISGWKIPRAISNWKNPNGYTVPLDKRSIQSGNAKLEVSDKFAELAEALDKADRDARTQLSAKQEGRNLLMKDAERTKEKNITEMVNRVRQKRLKDNSISQSRTDYQDKSSTISKLKYLAHKEGREVSEKVLLGAANNIDYSTTSNDVQVDSRLYLQGAKKSRNEQDPLYDNPLFVQQDIDSIYRPDVGKLDDMVDPSVQSTRELKPVEFTKAETESSAEKNKQYGLQH